jgi:hypothetical protein
MSGKSQFGIRAGVRTAVLSIGAPSTKAAARSSPVGIGSIVASARMRWSARHQSNECHQWIRQVLTDVLRELRSSVAHLKTLTLRSTRM